MVPLSSGTERNVGGLDRTGRLVAGALLVLAAIVVYMGYLGLGPAVAVVAPVVGAVLLVTGATQRCPINQAAGSNTIRR